LTAVNRREFLKNAGRAAAAAALLGVPGCTPSPSTRTSQPATPTPSPRPNGPPNAADWAALASGISGSVVRPGDGTYAVATQLFNPRFDTIRPAAVVYCQSTADVQRTVAFARAHGLPITARAGGHSYAGYSTGTGVVCDVTRMATVAVRDDGSAVIGAGARLIDAYAALAPYGAAIPAGSCPTVGVAGLALGGGLGVVGRKFGLTCDSITALQVVTAAGDAVSCDATTNSDLFWACRGGGGGNFGVVTSMTFATHPASTLTLFGIGWPWAAAGQVIAAWQQWIATIPDELWSNCHILSSPSSRLPAISVGGAYVGGQAELAPWLNALRGAVGTAATSVSLGTHGYLDGMLVEAGCAGQSVASCHLPSQTPQGALQREASLGRSDIILQPWSSAAIDIVVAGVAQRQANPQATTIAGVALDALGGAINRVPADATAFVHRSGLFSVQYNATWPTGASAGVTQSNVDGVNSLYAAMRAYASGSAYQNYIDPQLVDWQTAYYGGNLARLQTVKAKYDPADLFHFAQSIPAR
jgi:FAD/FMN-containing dehydrogenase